VPSRKRMSAKREGMEPLPYEQTINHIVGVATCRPRAFGKRPYEHPQNNVVGEGLCALPQKDER